MGLSCAMVIGVVGVLCLVTLLAGSGVAAGNLVTNGSFDKFDAALPDGWSASTNTSRVVSSISVGVGRNGGKCIRLSCTTYPVWGTETVGEKSFIQQDGIIIRPGRRYHISFWMRAQGVDDSLVNAAIAGITDEARTPLSKTLTVGDEWKRFDFDFTASRDNTKENALLVFSIQGLGSIWVDDVVVNTLGERPALISPRVASIGSKNLVPNGSFEAGASGWSTLGIEAKGWGGDLCGLFGDVVSIGALDGLKCLRIDLGPGKTPVAYYDAWPAQMSVHTAPLVANLGWIDVEKGKTYTLSVYMKADRPGIKGKLMFRFGAVSDKSGISVTDRQTEVELSEEWTRYEFITVAEQSQVFVAAGPDLSATPDASAVTWIDSVQLEEAPAASIFAPREQIEVGFDTAKIGNVFSAGEAASIRVTTANRSSQDALITVKRTVTDYFGKTVSTDDLTVAAPTGISSAQEWPLGVSSTGFYRVDLFWMSCGVRHSDSLRVVVAEPYTAPDSAFGMNHAPFTEKLCKLMMKAGITWGRDWSVNRGHLEPEPGKLSWELSDQQIYRVRDVGMNVVSLLPPVPSTDWDSTAPADVAPTLWYRMRYMPKDVTLVKDFVTKAVNRYKATVKTWEFLNEPVWTEFALPSTGYKIPGGGYKPSDYISFLKQVAPAIKAADPECKVIGGFSAEPWRYSEEFITSGAMDYIDIFNLHYYPAFKSPESYISEMRQLLDLMDKHGARKPIWITEYSYYAADEKPWRPWIPPTGHWSANLLLDDERQASDWTVRYNIIMLAHGVEKLFYHQGVSGSVNNVASGLEFALLAPEGELRKAYAAQAALASVLGPDVKFSAAFDKPAEIGGHSTYRVYGYSFQCGNRAVMAVWTTESDAAKRTWTVDVPKGVSARNVVGASISGRSVGLGPSPIYLVSDGRKAAELAKACRLRIIPVPIR